MGEAAMLFFVQFEDLGNLLIRYHTRDSWVKELQDGGVLKAVKVHTDSNVSDILTKCSTPTRIQQIIDLVNQRATQIAAARGDVGSLPAPHGT